MKKVTTNLSGEISKKDKIHFGGVYSFLEKINKKGIGSPKSIYIKGISEFDKTTRGIEGEISFINFELLKNGLIIRQSINQRNTCVGVKLDKISSITLLAIRIQIETRKVGFLTTKIVHRGELEIIETTGLISKFSILTKDFKALHSFFQKKEFKEKFSLSISNTPPEKDRGHLLDVFLNFLLK